MINYKNAQDGFEAASTSARPAPREPPAAPGLREGAERRGLTARLRFVLAGTAPTALLLRQARGAAEQDGRSRALAGPPRRAPTAAFARRRSMRGAGGPGGRAPWPSQEEESELAKSTHF